jgi:uncharacterized membrane protein YuzA (DUF378 family)
MPSELANPFIFIFIICLLNLMIGNFSAFKIVAKALGSSLQAWDYHSESIKCKPILFGVISSSSLLFYIMTCGICAISPLLLCYSSTMNIIPYSFKLAVMKVGNPFWKCLSLSVYLS